MHRLTASAALAIMLASHTALSQSETSPDQPKAQQLVQSAPMTGNLEPGDTHRYAIDADASSFYFGEVNQFSVDVVVRVIGPDGDQIAEIDGPARGAESFRLETDEPGTYIIEVSPFDDETGSYEVALLRGEPLATTPAGRINQLLAPYDRADVPGAAIGDVLDGELIFSRAYGSANLAYGLPFTTTTPTNIGSTSKQFTAFAVLLLEQQGELSLDDDVRDHVPELPDFGPTITIRNLLTHTSGYREFLNTVLLAGRRMDLGDGIERSELIEVVQRQPTLQNQPGEEFNYNNTGYGLAALIVERVSGTTFPEWMDEKVFTPLGMHNTRVRENPLEIIPGRAMGHLPSETGWTDAKDLGAAMGAGGIYSTPEDLAKWIANFGTHELGGPELFEKLSTRNRLNNGNQTDYAMGLMVDTFEDARRVHHGGADVAHRSMLMYFPEFNGGVVTLSNNAVFDGSISNAVARAFFEDQLRLNAETPTEEDATEDPTESDDSAFDPAEFDYDQLDRMVGLYALEVQPSFVLEFTRDGDRFLLQPTGQPQVEISPIGPTEFDLNVAEGSIEFHREDDGTFPTLTLHQGPGLKANRLDDVAWEPTSDDLAAFAGRYFSEELETFYTITASEDTLTLEQRRFEGPITLTPGKSEGTFSGDMPVANAEFVIADDGSVTLTVGNGRARGIVFEKLAGTSTDESQR
ncbi:MAG: serine hydrolase domain-containing protein [Planctomycetota bacterium]